MYCSEIYLGRIIPSKRCKLPICDKESAERKVLFDTEGQANLSINELWDGICSLPFSSTSDSKNAIRIITLPFALPAQLTHQHVKICYFATASDVQNYTNQLFTKQIASLRAKTSDKDTAGNLPSLCAQLHRCLLSEINTTYSSSQLQYVCSGPINLCMQASIASPEFDLHLRSDLQQDAVPQFRQNEKIWMVINSYLTVFTHGVYTVLGVRRVYANMIKTARSLLDLSTGNEPPTILDPNLVSDFLLHIFYEGVDRDKAFQVRRHWQTISTTEIQIAKREHYPYVPCDDILILYSSPV